jgi:hypothetical protein
MQLKKPVMPVINNFCSIIVNNHDSHGRDGHDHGRGASRGHGIQLRNLRSQMQISARRPILKCAFS